MPLATGDAIVPVAIGAIVAAMAPGGHRPLAKRGAPLPGSVAPRLRSDTSPTHSLMRWRDAEL